MMRIPVAAPSVPEFSRPADVDAVTADEMVRTVEATPQERRALAERLELEALDSLVATLRLRRVRGGEMVSVRGTIVADVVQTCVVTLEPVRNHVEDTFEEVFAPPHLVPELGPDVEFDPLDEDIPEPIENGRIDLGELTAQHLSLSLDPYPRVPGLEHLDTTAGEMGDHTGDETGAPGPERRNPFAALAKLKPPH
ncbi:MAG TPA: DUF177 domain-containing protein [Arenibaculum sp.]|nr:DUF177 domain-containing protein [Arenibaculum sp.]